MGGNSHMVREGENISVACGFRKKVCVCCCSGVWNVKISPRTGGLAGRWWGHRCKISYTGMGYIYLSSVCTVRCMDIISTYTRMVRGYVYVYDITVLRDFFLFSFWFLPYAYCRPNFPLLSGWHVNFIFIYQNNYESWVQGQRDWKNEESLLKSPFFFSFILPSTIIFL